MWLISSFPLFLPLAGPAFRLGWNRKGAGFTLSLLFLYYSPLLLHASHAPSPIAIFLLLSQSCEVKAELPNVWWMDEQMDESAFGICEPLNL